MKLAIYFLFAISIHAQEPAHQSADFLDSTGKLELSNLTTNNIVISNWSHSVQPWITLRNCCTGATRNLTIDLNKGETMYVSTDGIRIPSPALMKSLLKWQWIVQEISRGL